MNILVTGSEGYIGSVLVPYLRKHGYEVSGLDTCYFQNRNFLNQNQKYPLIKEDIRDIKSEQLKGFDAICHLAALSNDPAGDLIPGVTEDINYKGTVTLAEKAKEAGVKKFIFSSSCSIYGAGDTSSLLDENASFNPVTAYGMSKVLSERDLSQMADDNFSPVYLRNATAFGISPKLRLDIVVNNLVAHAYTTNKISMTSDGSPWRPLVHVQDICLAFKSALETPTEIVHNQAFNIGRSDANYQIKDIANTIKEIIDDTQIVFGIESNDKRTYRVNFDKSKNLLRGFAPEWDLKSGIKEIYNAYKEFGLKESALTGNDFITLNQYKNLLNNNQIDKNFKWVR